MPELTLTASVGNNGVNDPDDVMALKERLVVCVQGVNRGWS
jgi:hypothetical protein